MQYVSYQDPQHPEEWRVEVKADPHEEEGTSATFSGPLAEERAKAYASVMNAEQQIPVLELCVGDTLLMTFNMMTTKQMRSIETRFNICIEGTKPGTVPSLAILREMVP